MSGPVRKNGRISVSTEKLLNSGEYREKVESVRVPKTVWTSTKKWWNQCEYRKIVESWRVPGKGGIRVSTEKLSHPNFFFLMIIIYSSTKELILKYSISALRKFKC